MSELYLSQSSLQNLAEQLELPVQLDYHNGCLVIIGSYDLLGKRQFQVDLGFEKIVDTKIILKIVDTRPAVNFLGSTFKRWILNLSQQFGLLPEKAANAMTIDFPYVTVHGEEIQQIRQALKFCVVKGVDFDPEGIRLRFHFIQSKNHMKTTDTL